MANNCLVTKLKGSVQNDNLPVFGTGIMEVEVALASVGTPALLHYTGKGPIVFEIIEGDVSSVTYPQQHTFMRKEGNKIYVDRNDTYDSKSASWFPIQFTTTGAYKIRFNKYNCRPKVSNWDQAFRIAFRTSVDDIKYIDTDLGKYDDYTNTLLLGEGSLKDAVKLFSNKFIQVFQRDHTQGWFLSLVSGDISALLDIADLTFIECALLPNITGDIASLTAHQNKTNITVIEISNCDAISGNLNTVLPQFPALTRFNGENGYKFTGNLDTIATNCIAAGRQAGTSLIIKGNLQNVVPNPTIAGKTINFISDGQGGVTYEIV